MLLLSNYSFLGRNNSLDRSCLSLNSCFALFNRELHMLVDIAFYFPSRPRRYEVECSFLGCKIPRIGLSFIDLNVDPRCLPLHRSFLN
jgi:hypothetical protein